MYNTAKTLLEACQQGGLTIAEASAERELQETGQSREELYAYLQRCWDVMQASGRNATKTPTYSLSGLTGGNAVRMQEYHDQGDTYCGADLSQAMAYALSTSETNATMGRIVAAPTAGAAGILPACMLHAADSGRYTEEQILDALLTATAIGCIIATCATHSGAEGGCQAECGAAAAMAAAALVSLKGGSPEIACTASGFALMNVMGLVCDPVGGLVEFPCALRNASGVANAFSAADLALAGVVTIVPLDEVVDALYQVGRALPATLRETALGGVAIAESACAACSACGIH